MNTKTYFDLPFLENVLGQPTQKGSSNVVIERVETDSRKSLNQTLFVAIRGEKFDGHDFIHQVVNHGAQAILCSRKFDLAKVTIPSSCWVFQMEDTGKAYTALAREWRKRFKIPVIAIAGSVGKTTTKEILFSVLKGKFEYVLKTTGSQNGFVGIPMTLLELRNHHQVAVIEVGIDEIGAMDQHVQTVNPDLAVLTAIGPEHLEKLIDVPTVAVEELKTLEFTSEKLRTTIINFNDPYIRQWNDDVDGFMKPHHFVFTLDENNPAASLNAISLNESLQITKKNGNKFSVPLVLSGKHNAGNQLAAIAVGLSLGLDADEIKKGLKEFVPAFGRSKIEKLKSGVSVLCDYYNANPTSMFAAFENLKNLASGNAATHICIADMKELGDQEERYHRDLARPILTLKPKLVYLYGEKMRWLEDELKQISASFSVMYFEDKVALAHKLKANLNPQDWVLIKGSRSMKMEEVMEVLRD